MKSYFPALIGLILFCVFASAGPEIIYEEDSTLLATSLQVVFTSGSQSDDSGKNGQAEILTKLLLRGTKTLDRTQFQSRTEILGGSLDGESSIDTMEFSGVVIKENTLPFLELVEDFLLNPRFDASEFTALKKESLNDLLDTKNNNSRLAGLALRKTLFKGTNLEIPGSGSLTTLESLTLEDIVNRYKKSLHKGNVLFAVASPLKKSQIKPILERIYSRLPDGKREVVAPTPINAPSKPTLVLVNKPKTSTGILMMGQAGITATDPDRYTLLTGNFEFGGNPLTSRIFTVIRKELGWTYAIGSTYSALGGYTKQKGLFMIYSTPSVEFTAKTLFKTLSMWQDYLKNGLKAPEFKLAKESLINSYPFEFDSAAKRLGKKVVEYLYGVPILSPSKYASTLNGIENPALIKALGNAHTPEGWVVAMLGEPAEMEKQLKEMQKDIPTEEQLKISQVFTPDDVIR